MILWSSIDLFCPFYLLFILVVTKYRYIGSVVHLFVDRYCLRYTLHYTHAYRRQFIAPANSARNWENVELRFQGCDGFGAECCVQPWSEPPFLLINSMFMTSHDTHARKYRKWVGDDADTTMWCVIVVVVPGPSPAHLFIPTGSKVETFPSPSCWRTLNVNLSPSNLQISIVRVFNLGA